MDDAPHVDRDLWHTFLARHVVSVEEQEAFLDYLIEQETLAIGTLHDLEDAYRQFLRRGSPPVDIH